MIFQITIGGTTTTIEPHLPFVGSDGSFHPCVVLRLWTDEELAQIGVTRALTTEEIAAGMELS